MQDAFCYNLALCRKEKKPCTTKKRPRRLSRLSTAVLLKPLIVILLLVELMPAGNGTILRRFGAKHGLPGRRDHLDGSIRPYAL